MSLSLPEALAVALRDVYRIEGEIGRGGMATVYKAEDRKHHRAVAIKVLSPELGSEAGRDRFLREIRTTAGLAHPHILPLHDSGAAGDLLYYVTPFIEGETLRTRLDRERQLPLETALQWTREMAGALAHAHRQGFVHRDVKPENILLSDGIAIVADFGIAHALEQVSDPDATRAVTRAGALLGTPRYMSPEQVIGGPIDGRADLYALACVLYEMLAGEPPFLAPTSDGLMRMHLASEARPVTDLRPSLPPALSSALHRGLAKDPADRYESGARFVEALVAASRDGQPVVAPSARTPNNLPKARTPFIGREKELEECMTLLRAGPLVTLTGIGGSGKTRLARKVAEGVLAEYPDGVWFVDLAPLSDPALVAEAVAAPLGIRQEPEKDLRGEIQAALRGKRVLLVLDSCEHLLDTCADLAGTLLTGDGATRILVTSREGLGIEGERIVALRSLAVPSEDAARDPREVERSDAARLFVDRAGSVLPGFTLTAKNAPFVAEICRRLDGIPLAIELAAARVKVLSVEEIRDRLHDRFRLLTGGSKMALPRHQTLLSTIQWSYDQLAPEEQALLGTLAVFAGGWTLESATRVTGADEFTTLDLFARLVDKSLVLVEREGEGSTRYRFLETVRQYAEERLQESGASEATRRRHLEEFLAMAETAYREPFVREGSWSAALEAEHDNLRVALQRAQGFDPEGYLELAGALAWFWQARSHLIEGREHVRSALQATSAEPPRPARARALWGLANMLSWQGETSAALQRMDEALALWRALGLRSEVALALEGLGWALLLDGQEERAREVLEECLQLQEDLGDAVLVNRARVGLAQVLVSLNDTGRARALSSEIIAFSSAAADRRSEHFGWHFLADSALIEGHYEESLSLYRKSLLLARAMGDRLEMSFEVQGVAMSLSGLGRHEVALRLAGAAKGEWARIGADVHMRFWDALMDRHFEASRRALGAEAGGAWDAGFELPFEKAMALALQS